MMSLLPWMTRGGRVGLGSKRCGPSASPPLGWTHYLALPGRLDPSEHQDLEGNSPVQVPLLDGAGHDQTAEEEEVGVQEVLGADLVGGQDAQEGEEDDGQQGRHREGQGLCAPVHRHEQDDEQAATFLQGGDAGPGGSAELGVAEGEEVLEQGPSGPIPRRGSGEGKCPRLRL